MAVWRISGFREVRELGSGGQGRVVLAVHRESGTPVAIKYLSVRADEQDRDRLRHEARMLGQVTSPHVARLYRLVESEQGAAIVMEAVNGVSLKEILARYGRLEPRAALAVLKGSLLGLAAAHAVGVVHRDYKPANVIVPADGRSKLIDFGIAAPAGIASRAGTPAYMAPEQWRNEPATAATDVYAATCVFYECITGRRPYRAGDRAKLMARQATAPVPLDDVPEPLRAVVVRGMAENAVERPPGAAAFVDELERAARAAYGADWEDQGVRALAAAAIALASLFPVTAAGLAGTGLVGAAGAAGSTGAGAALGAKGAGTGLLAGTGAKVTAALAVTAAVTTGGLAYTLREDPEPPAVKVSVTTRTLSQNLSDINLIVQNAEYAVVGGLSDRTVRQRVNQALRAPVDQAITDYRRHWEQVAPYPVGGQTSPPVRLTVKVSYGRRGPRLLSVRYLINNPVYAAGGINATVKSVNVDLTRGRILTPADIFTPAALADAAALSRRVPPPPPLRFDTASCPFTPISDLGEIGGVAATGPMFTDDRLVFTFRQWGECIGDRTREVPYSRLADLLKPDVLRLAQGG